MPKDEWGKSKNKEIARRLNRELAQEREIQEALWDARYFAEGSDNLASELLQESEWTVCKYCQRSLRFSDYDDHMSRCKDRGSPTVKKSSTALPRSASSATNPKVASKPTLQRPEIGSSVRIGPTVGTVLRIEGNKLVIQSGKKVKLFRMDWARIIVLPVAKVAPEAIPKQLPKSRKNRRRK